MNKQFYRRRNFLKALIVGGFALTAAGTILWRTNQETNIIVAILENKLGKLKISDDAFLLFANEYVREKEQFKKQFTYLSLLSNIFTVMTPDALLPMNHPLKRMEDNIVSNFLLSTDFFQNGADINKKVNYLGFYDPYKRPCANFFS
jgi:hypothetical protein